MTCKDSTRAAVLKLLAAGEMTQAEAARVSGESKQLIKYWADRAALNCVDSREARLARLWEKVAK